MFVMCDRIYAPHMHSRTLAQAGAAPVILQKRAQAADVRSSVRKSA
jgi:hypothetical protein